MYDCGRVDFQGSEVGGGDGGGSPSATKRAPREKGVSAGGKEAGRRESEGYMHVGARLSSLQLTGGGGDGVGSHYRSRSCTRPRPAGGLRRRRLPFESATDLTAAASSAVMLSAAVLPAALSSAIVTTEISLSVMGPVAGPAESSSRTETNLPPARGCERSRYARVRAALNDV